MGVLTFHENDARKEDEYLIVQLEFSICHRSFSNMSTVEMDSYEGYIQWAS